MRECICGGEIKERREPCIFEDNCKGCALCVKGEIVLVWCENDNCILRDVESDEEGD